MRHSRPIIAIRRSCLTGKIVWVYSAPTKGAARQAYSLACKMEVERVRRWSERTARFRANIQRFLAECMSEIPINAELTPQQTEAARQLKAIEKKGIACYREFYNHVVEERRRRQEDKEFRRKMREREKLSNANYDK